MPAEPRKLSDFEGRWQLTRTIRPAEGPGGRFDGVALWWPVMGGLAYEERGVLRLEGQSEMQAERRYFWDAGLDVYFDDGRFFHSVPAVGGAAHHWCAPDQYDVTYDFSGWPEFEAVWRVRGPRKDYELISHYTRSDA
ncbi:MAG: trigger factor [Spiribacter salinus]|uniref:Trigger factor n=1 Tax=Spiribacter salinus TaxID=1335746 RepID=A0A540VU27_9GAMM|nr:MAG: trigger factor [Spiribacter salinus]